MRRTLYWVCLVFLTVLLSGCGTYYTVSVDSLRDDRAAAGVRSFFPEPADKHVSADDLQFREVVQMLEPAFLAQGCTLENNRSRADGVARISFWEEEPRVTMETRTVSRSQPVILRDGKKERVEYIRVEEPTLETHTTYTAKLLVEAFAPPRSGKQIWRTLVTCSSSSGTLRTLLDAMRPVLPGILGTRTQRIRTFEVCIEDDGTVSVKEY